MLKQITALIITLLCSCVLQAGPYSPPAGQQGSTAIAHNDPNFIAWATGAVIERGLQDISYDEPNYAWYGAESDAIGPAGTSTTESVVSLGDGGIATLEFAKPIRNAEGWDFAVFENSYSNTFLELAFVEVSSDGQNYYRFNSISLTDPNIQVGGFGSIDTTNIHNLAGKYRVGYGTPFDLEELNGIEGLDINSITNIRIIDVVGCIQTADFNNDGFVDFMDYSIISNALSTYAGDTNWNAKCDIAPTRDDGSINYDGKIDILDLQEFFRQWLTEWASLDSMGNKINDPYPTPFAAGGFDLDAVGVRYQAETIN